MPVYDKIKYHTGKQVDEVKLLFAQDLEEIKQLIRNVFKENGELLEVWLGGKQRRMFEDAAE